VAALANSDGWMLIPLITYQEVAPEIVLPKINNPNNDINDVIYIKLENLS